MYGIKRHHSSYKKTSEINSLLEQKQYSVYQLLSNTNCSSHWVSRQRPDPITGCCYSTLARIVGIWDSGTQTDGFRVSRISQRFSVNCQRIAGEDVWNVPDRQTLQNTPSHTLETTAGDIRDTRMITNNMHNTSLILLNKLYSIYSVCMHSYTLCVYSTWERERECVCYSYIEREVSCVVSVYST